MKRKLYLYPLMAFTAATFVLAGCDDKKDQDQTAVGTEATAPAGDQTMTSTMPSATDTAGTTATTAPVAAAVTAEGATAYATTEGTTTGAVFLTLHNTGSEADRLIGASSDKSTVEIHENSVGPDGTSQMRKVDAIDVPAGQQVTLKADGYHLMLTGLSQPLTQGETFNVTLDFEKAPDVTVPVTIVAPGDSSAGTMTMDHSTTGDSSMGSATGSAVTTSPDAATTAPSGDMSSDTTGTGSTSGDTSTGAGGSMSGDTTSTDTTGTGTTSGTTSSDMPADEQSAE